MGIISDKNLINAVKCLGKIDSFNIWYVVLQSEDIEVRSDCVRQCLCAYLTDDSNTLIKEYLVSNCILLWPFNLAMLSVYLKNSYCFSPLERQHWGGERGIAQTTMGLYRVQKEGADDEKRPEGFWSGNWKRGTNKQAGNVSFGCAMLFGLIYTLNLSYLHELKFTIWDLPESVDELQW